MAYQLLAGIALGVLAGTFTGLVPGIHVNLIAVLLLSSAGYLLGFIGLEALIVFIVSMSVTHSFINTIPSIFLGAPEGGTALSVLPGHRLLLEGNGLEAVKLTIIGSVLGLLFSFAAYPFFVFVLSNIYGFLSNYIGELLFFVGVFLVLRSGKVFQGFLAFSFSGVLGLLVLNARMENPLFPLLTGLFGVATLVFSLKTNSKIPFQKKKRSVGFDRKQGFLSVFLGSVSGFITAVLPGMGTSVAATISSLFRSDSDARNFLVMIGAISTVNFFMSIAALSVIGKARNGAIIAVSELLAEPNSLLLLMAALISGGLAVLVGLRINTFFLGVMEKVNYALMVKIVIYLLIVLTGILSGFEGLVVLFVASLIGLYANFKGLPRNVLMSCIMVPVMSYFLF